MENYYELVDFQMEGRDKVEIRDGRVYDLRSTIIKSNNPMITVPRRYNAPMSDQDLKRAKNLAKKKIGSGHDCFLKGIGVRFDVNFTQSVWQQFKRYNWFDFVSSCSTMHCVTKMDLNEQKCDCSHLAYMLDIYDTYSATIDYPATIEINGELVTVETKRDMFEEVVKTIPSGFRLWASMTTNYLQLKTIYSQRKNHKMSDARDFCKWIETLPMSELITGK